MKKKKPEKTMEDLAKDCGYYGPAMKTLRCDFLLMSVYDSYARGTLTYEEARKMFRDVVAAEDHYVQRNADEKLALLTAKDWDDLQNVFNKVRDHKGPFATWPEPKELEQGVRQFPYSDWSETLLHFQHIFYEKGLIIAFDWGAWDEGLAIFNSKDENKFADLDAETVLKLFTSTIRNDRFSDGLLANFFQNGDGEKLLARLLEFRPTGREE